MCRLCGVSYIDFWDYTPAETSAMLDVANQKLEYDTVKHAQILMWIANSRRVQRKDNRLFELNDFLPGFAKQERTAEDFFEELWNAAD